MPNDEKDSPGQAAAVRPVGWFGIAGISNVAEMNEIVPSAFLHAAAAGLHGAVVEELYGIERCTAKQRLPCEASFNMWCVE